jgi:hypothetical protein
MKHAKPQKQALAFAMSSARNAKKMAEGGEVEKDDKKPKHEGWPYITSPGPIEPLPKMARGGMAEEEEPHVSLAKAIHAKRMAAGGEVEASEEAERTHLPELEDEAEEMEEEEHEGHGEPEEEEKGLIQRILDKLRYGK